ATVGDNEREGQRQRRVRHDVAADIEGPGQGGGIGRHRRVGADLCDGYGETGELVGRALPGEAFGVELDRRMGRLRLVLPDRVDRVAVDRDELAALLVQRGAQHARLGDRVQPGIEAYAPALRRVGAHPARGRGVDKAPDREGRAVDL